MKEQLAAGLSERQVAELVENNEVHAGEIFDEPPLPAGGGLVLQPVDAINDGVEAAPGATADAARAIAMARCGIAGARSTGQHSVKLFGEKVAARQIADHRLIDRCAGEVELVDVFGQRQLGDGQLILDRARLFLGDLGA